MQILGERILVKVEVKKQTNGGIIIPDSVVEKPNVGEIVAIGNWIPESTGCKDLQVGDWVKWMKYAGEEIELDGQKLLMIRPNDIFATVEKPSLVIL
jgi:chaperonin GroES